MAGCIPVQRLAGVIPAEKWTGNIPVWFRSGTGPAPVCSRPGMFHFRPGKFPTGNFPGRDGFGRWGHYCPTLYQYQITSCSTARHLAKYTAFDCNIVILGDMGGGLSPTLQQPYLMYSATIRSYPLYSLSVNAVTRRYATWADSKLGHMDEVVSYRWEGMGEVSNQCMLVYLGLGVRLTTSTLYNPTSTRYRRVLTSWVPLTR